MWMGKKRAETIISVPNFYRRHLIICMYGVCTFYICFDNMQMSCGIQSDVINLLCSFVVPSVVDAECIKFNDLFVYLEFIATAVLTVCKILIKENLPTLNEWDTLKTLTDEQGKRMFTCIRIATVVPSNFHLGFDWTPEKGFDIQIHLETMFENIF